MSQPHARILLVDDEPYVLLTAQKILQQENYTVNAVQGREGSVTAELRALNGDGVEVEIRDTGIGIAPEHQVKILDELRRVRHGKANGRPGSGPGLAIVRRIAEAHGDEIVVNSAPGRGSAFRESLPVSQRTRSAVSA